MTITFKVSDATANVISNSKPIQLKDLYNNNNNNRPDSSKNNNNIERKVIKTSINDSTLSFGGLNSFVQSCFMAYSKHHNLVIRPDDIWNAILIQFSIYINANAEELRDKFVDFNGKKELTVNASGTLMTAPYQELAIELTKQIEKNIKDPSIRNWVMGKFTTTTDNDQMVSSIVLMANLKSYFEYKIELDCNLPSVTLEGEVSDYIDIKNRIERIAEFDSSKNGNAISKWLNLLRPVIDQLIKSASGNPDTQWWNKIVNRVGGGSGPSYLSGWINVFVAFNDSGEYVLDKVKEYRQFRSEPITSEWGFIETDSLPKSFVSVPVIIDDNGVEYKTEFFAGHIGLSLPNETTIKPTLNWAITLLNE